MRMTGSGYDDIMNMATHKRRYFIMNMKREKEEHEEQAEEQAQEGSQSDGKRTKRISGDELKQKMKSGEIPNQ